MNAILELITYWLLQTPLYLPCSSLWKFWNVSGLKEEFNIWKYWIEGRVMKNIRDYVAKHKMLDLISYCHKLSSCASGRHINKCMTVHSSGDPGRAWPWWGHPGKCWEEPYTKVRGASQLAAAAGVQPVHGRATHCRPLLWHITPLTSMPDPIHWLHLNTRQQHSPSCPVWRLRPARHSPLGPGCIGDTLPNEHRFGSTYFRYSPCKDKAQAAWCEGDSQVLSLWCLHNQSGAS